jgi:ribosomal protein S18 acetylase RimI-like enzyme
MASCGAMQIRIATAADAALLAELSERTFRETFAADNTPENMAAYLASAFSESIQAAELADEATIFLIAEIEGAPVGYAKLQLDGDDTIEINRLYAATERIGSGVGAALMQASLDEASRRGREKVWLAVWDQNQRARAFYQKWGFEQVGSKPFVLGDDVQTDLVLTRSSRT